jgi:hypothetical protein
MSKTDPKGKKSEASTASSPQPLNASKPQPNAKPDSPPASRGGHTWIWTFLLFAVAAAGVSILIVRSSETPAPLASASEDEASEATPLETESDLPAAAETETVEETVVAAEKEATPRAPTTGTLVVRSDVEGADVLLNGKRVGKTPHQAKGLAAGSYDVRVQKEGYEPFQKKVQVTKAKQELTANLVPASATLKVAANVSGAKVLLDGEERGTTPLTLEDLRPGRYQLSVSASGYRTHTETLELAGGAREVSIDLVSPLANLNEAVAVKHKHRLGTCEGVLRATASGIVYESEHKDAFRAELARVSDLDLDGDELSLKLEGGKNYNFKERNDNDDALATFYDRVKVAVGSGREK